MKKRLKLLSLILAITLTFSSCSLFKQSVTDLVEPPLLRNDQKEIISVLQKEAGQSVVLEYPAKGNNISPFITRDFDKDGSDEVVAFYSTDNAERVKVAYLRKQEGKWGLVFSKDGAGNSVVKADTISFKNVGANNLIVGFTVSGTEDTLIVYDLDRSGEELCSAEFTDYQIVSMGSAIRESFVVFKLFTDGAVKKQTVSYYSFATDGNSLLDSFTGETVSVSYLNMAAQVLPDFSAFIYVDSLVNNAVMTEVFKITDGKISVARSQGFERNTGVYCTDIDGDGYPEIPSVVPYSVNTEGLEEKNILGLIGWFKISGDNLEKVCDSAVNHNLGYILRLPERFENRIILTSNEAGNLLSAYVYTGDTEKKGTEVFTVKVLYKGDESDTQGYSKIYEGKSIVFYAKVNNKIYDIDKNLEISYDELKECLIVL